MTRVLGEVQCYSFEIRGTITTYTINTGMILRHLHGPLDPLGRIGTLSTIPHTWYDDIYVIEQK